MVEYPESGPPSAILRIELEQKHILLEYKWLYLERTKHTALRVKKLTVIITLKINCGSTKLTIVEIIIDRAVMKDTKFAFYTFSRQERFLFG